MRALKALVIVVVGMTLAGCVWSVHPAYSDTETASGPDLAGVWIGGEGQTFAIVQPTGQNAFRITYMDKETADGAAGTYEAHLFQAGSEWFLDVLPEEKAVDAVLNARPFWGLLETHTFFRVRLQGEEAELALVDDQLIKKMDPAGASRAYERVKDGYLFTAPSAELRALLQRYAEDNEAFDKPAHYRRLK